MNRSDSYRVQEQLELLGYQPVVDPEAADVLFMNTCVVRQSAEDRAMGRMLSLKSLLDGERRRALLVMGCLVDDPQRMKEAYPFVNAFFQPSDIEGVSRYVRAWENGTDSVSGELVTPPQISDLVPISYGCDHHCTYCIVTMRRGPQRSRSIVEIVADARSLVAHGTKEIVLLGQNVDAYGSDLDEPVDLADVLMAVHEIEGLERLRFLTSHPREMSQRIIDTVGQLPKVCPTWELAVQSGDDDVLRRMARGYTAERFLDVVSRIRQSTPDCAINTDIIVGFCGETDAEFEHTLDLLRTVRCDQVHAASYSVRPGTPASRWEDDVLPEVKEARRKAVEALQEEIASEIAAQFLGETVEVLVEGRSRNRWRGRTTTNRLVFFESDDDYHGKLARVKIFWTGPWSLIGEIVGSAPAGD